MTELVKRVKPWRWSAIPEAERAARVRRELLARGFSVVRADAIEIAPEEASRSPWSYVERLLGARPAIVERQPIKAVPGGRSFASSDAPTPLHTDSQMFAGAPPRVQVMACVRPADRGGASLLADAWALLDRVEASDPDLYRALLEAPRRVPFVFGDVFGPTASLRGGSLVFTLSPVPQPDDPIAARLAPWIDAAPRIELDLCAGEVLLVDNHRMLHGRRGFSGPREFVRLLAWIDLEPPPSRHRDRAEAVARVMSDRLAAAPDAVKHRLGLAAEATIDRRLAIVLEMLRGTPPGVLATRERIPEPELYRMRDAALTAAGAALAGSLSASDEEMDRALAVIAAADPER